ncbi:sulfonate transport system substrate-binding protein [Paraburkholderia eburnea]|uniref:Sulfonate transport system substrate-binding protein n=1 Tax=Paraburkholderia eburnea TaxID=1189126 RepID=A0A2S4M271_9BURK|nr:sulfonate transport system substrate-binding protein [Paraburkholderia eburnea]PRZ20852.1 sulfonate transport system substrate-binding protein [Paraburkholderia eburnea]
MRCAAARFAWQHIARIESALFVGVLVGRRFFAHFYAACLVAFALLALVSPHARAQNVIRIAVPDIGAASKPAGGGVVDVLNANQTLEKAFQKDGVKIQWTFFKGAGPAVNEAFANHQVDLAFLGDLAGIIGRANGLDTRLIAALARDVNGYLAVQPGQGIKDLKDLKGKQIALFRGTALQLSFDSVLRSEGLTERDFRVVNLDLNSAAAAIAAHRIDAVWGTSSLFILKDKGLVDIPVSTRGRDGIGTFKAGLVASGDFLRAHPEWAQRIVASVLEASDWVSDRKNLDAYLQLEQTRAGTPTSVWRNEIGDSDPATFFSPLLDPYYVNAFKRDVDTAKQLGMIRQSFDVDRWVDATYLNQALAQTKLAGRWQPSRTFTEVEKTAKTN